MFFKPTKIRNGALSARGKVSAARLLGLDSSGVSSSRADGISRYDGKEMPGTVNMIRSDIGQVSKRAGYKISEPPFDGIGGVFVFHHTSGDRYFFVSGDTVLMTDEKYRVISSSILPQTFDGCYCVQSGNYMFFLNGSCMVIYDVEKTKIMYLTDTGETNIISENDVYVPTVFIACTPDGAGAAYEAVNLFTPYVCEQYISDGTSDRYTLHFDCEGDIGAYIRNAQNEWEAVPVAAIGKEAMFDSAPPTPVVEGEDNVRIIYKRAGFRENAAKIAGCRCGTVYGVSGYKDRVFLSANAAYRGYVYYSELDEPMYFPDINYLRVGTDSSEVMALAGQDTALAVICNDNVYTVSGELSGNDAVFVISGIFKTPPPSGIQHPSVFDSEVVYLTDDGVCAIAASGILDERYCQIRSAFINRHLLKEELSDCIMLATEEFLVISNRRGRLYLLDGKQFSTAGDLPFSRRQYEGYVWENVPAKYIWEQSGCICFSDGTYIYRFNRGFEANGEYHDEVAIVGNAPITQAIYAYWETPEIHGGEFHLMKFFMRLGLIIGCGFGSDDRVLDTDVKILAKFDNESWRTVKDYGADFRVFRYSGIDYSRFNYGGNHKGYNIYKRLWHKRARALKLRFENGNYDEPLTLKEFCVEYNIM